MARKKRRRRMSALQRKFFGGRRKVRRAVKRLRRAARVRRRARRTRRITTVRRIITVKRRSSHRRRRGPVGGVRRGFAFIPPTETIIGMGGGALAGVLAGEFIMPKVFKDPSSFFNTSDFGTLAGQAVIGAVGYMGLKKFAPKYAASFFVGTLLMPLATIVWSKLVPAGTKGFAGLRADGMLPGGDRLNGTVYESAGTYANN